MTPAVKDLLERAGSTFLEALLASVVDAGSLTPAVGRVALYAAVIALLKWMLLEVRARRRA